MGFEPQIRQIVSQLPSDRQTVFFTATWPTAVKNLANEFLTNPVQINIGDSDSLNANKSIKQNIRIVKEHEKIRTLMGILENEINSESDNKRQIPKTIIFRSRKLDCDQLVDDLLDEGYTAGSLHGDKVQSARSRIMEKFRSGAIRILVATGTF